MLKILFVASFLCCVTPAYAQREDRQITSLSKCKVSQSGVNLGTTNAKTIVTVMWSKKYVSIGSVKYPIYDLVTDESGIWYRCKFGKSLVDIGFLTLPRGIMVAKYYYNQGMKVFTERTMYMDLD